ncbi:MAG: Fic family protein [Bacteroidia bacterium]|nr:Fic family protein [Bacteroidia bacterium]
MTLSAQDLRFRSVWLDLPALRWELLAPSWKARREYLEAQEELADCERDTIFGLARDFLELQGVAWFSTESWNQYSRASYESFALANGSVWPSAEEAHRHVQGLVTALEELQKRARAAQPVDSGLLSRLVSEAVGRSVDLRRDSTHRSFPARMVSPEQVETALGALLSEVESHFSAGVSPVWIAAWVHHALTQIRPYSDGNARAAFLLTQYVLWRGGLPGFSLKPSQRVAYYRALRKADEGDLADWGSLFLEGLHQVTLFALSWGRNALRSYEDSIAVFNRRFAGWRARHDRERSQRIMNNRYTVFDYMEELLRQLAAELDEKLKTEEGKGTRALVAKAYPDSPYYYQFTSDIVEYAKRHGYYFNRGLPRGWFKLKFSLSANKKYQLVFPLHHVGHDDATLAVGAMLHFLEPLKYQQKRARRRRAQKEKAVYLFAPLPLHMPPLAFSIEQDLPSVRTVLREYVQTSLTQALGELANEIY